MKIFDTVKKEEIEIKDTKELIDIMENGRQVDIHLDSVKTDADGYIKWDIEHWSCIEKNRFIRTFTLNGKVLGESTGHNIYDLANTFKPEEAVKIELS